MTAPIYLAGLYWVIIPATVHLLVVAVITFVEPVVDEIIRDIRVVAAVVTILAIWARIGAFVVAASIYLAVLHWVIIPATVFPIIF